MKVYIIIKDDYGYLDRYLGYGRETGSRPEVESVYKSFKDALCHLHETYKTLQVCEYANPFYGVKGKYRYYDKNDEHVYEFSIIEKELA